MRFFGLKSCDTCRKALKSLRAADIEPQVIDVRADGLTDDDITAIVNAFGDAIINKSSTTWRNLNDSEKANDPSDLLREHPTLMKRPVIDDEGWTMGWKPDVQSQHLGT